jgi:hypothetical protein
MARLLVVHHTTSPRLQALLEAVLSGAHDEAIQDVTVLARPALAATAIDVLGADGYLLGTPANLGYMSGALKHFFDQIYYPCLEATVGAALWAVRPRRQRHHRSRAGGRGDHPGPGMAPCPGPGGRARPPEPGGPPGLLGAWRRDGGRLDPVCRLTWSAPVEAVLP